MLINAILVLMVHTYHPLFSYELRVVVSCYSITVIWSPLSYSPTT